MRILPEFPVLSGSLPGVRAKGIVPGRDPEASLELLAVTFAPTQAPSGTVTLFFAGDAAIRLDVECIEVRMKDLGPVWEAEGRPVHGPEPAGEPSRAGG